MAGRPAWIVTVVNPEKLPAESHKIGHGHVIDGAVKSALIIKMSKHGPSTSSHKWETYRRRRFGRFSRRRATSVLRSVRKERATQKIGQSAIGPPGWLEKGPSVSLLARYGSQRIRSSLAPSIQTLLKPTVCLPLMRRCTSLVPDSINRF